MSNDKKHMEVTETNFGDLLIEGLTEALAIARGEKEPAKVSRRSTGLTQSPAVISDPTD